MSEEIEDLVAENKSKKNLQSGFFGVGGGTVFVLLTESLPSNSNLKPILKYCAPAITTLLTFIAHEIQRRYNDSARRKKQNYSLMLIDQFLADQTISIEHRAKLQLTKEKIQSSFIDYEIYRQRQRN